MIVKNFKLKHISIKEMLLRKEKYYCVETWSNRVNQFKNFEEIQFYVAEKSDRYNYARFYISYLDNQIYYFKRFTAFHSIFIGDDSETKYCGLIITPNGVVHKLLFNHLNSFDGYLQINNASIDFFKKELTPLGIMISDCI